MDSTYHNLKEHSQKSIRWLVNRFDVRKFTLTRRWLKCDRFTLTKIVHVLSKNKLLIQKDQIDIFGLIYGEFYHDAWYYSMTNVINFIPGTTLYKDLDRIFSFDNSDGNSDKIIDSRLTVRSYGIS